MPKDHHPKKTAIPPLSHSLRISRADPRTLSVSHSNTFKRDVVVADRRQCLMPSSLFDASSVVSLPYRVSTKLSTRFSLGHPKRGGPSPRPSKSSKSGSKIPPSLFEISKSGVPMFRHLGYFSRLLIVQIYTLKVRGLSGVSVCVSVCPNFVPIFKRVPSMQISSGWQD